MSGAGPATELIDRRFARDQITTLRRDVTLAARSAGLSGDRLNGFVLAIHELVTNAVRHGGGHGHLILRREAHLLSCDVTDHGPGLADSTPGLPGADSPGGRGLWLADQLSDALRLAVRADGLTASVLAYVDTTAAEPAPGDS
ncbi:ATP-binding protein [Actinoplanes siamensis]|uniref:Histidine kinase/HSP90-like ATPase domain-containing protein n=1 Tax=Actinoplanes siamensis TaxID=1223317 RepID=A0A919KBZ9_9ACTN|nr:ATP-binding protein [Actinoplanes siamensis]GIF02778.1 hypothetical protein Asi03nite_03160 [Actinoplanes siamensis]